MTTDQDALREAQAEIEKLRSENQKLREDGAVKSHWGWVRGTAVGVLLALGFLLVPISGIAVWSRNTLLNTDRYVETVAPLSQSPAVIDDVANAITKAIFDQIDVETLLAQNLPPKLSFAAGPIAGQVQSTTKDLVVKALESDQFRLLWNAVNRQASASVVAFVTGSNTSTVLQVQNGQLILNLQPVVDDVKQRLSSQGLDFVNKLPSVSSNVELPVADVQYLVDARQMAKLLNTMAFVLPLLSLLCFGLAIWLSRRRRRTLVTSALLVSGGALVVGLGLAVGRGLYLDAMATSPAISAESAAVVFDTLVRFLRNGIRVIFFLGLIVAFAAAVTGPSAWAVKVRETSGGLLTEGGRRSGVDTGPVGRFLAAHRKGYRVTAIALFGVILFLLSGVTPGTIAWLVVGLLVVLAVLEFLAATAPTDDAGTEAPPEPVPTGSGGAGTPAG